MAYNLVFLGLINFFELSPKGRLVLIPDGRTRTKRVIDPKDKITPHFASILVEEANVDSSRTTWPSKLQIYMGIPVLQFTISKRSDIAISGQEAGSGTPTFDDTDFESRSIKLKDRKLEIARADALTIAEVELRQGTLHSRRLKNTATAILRVPDHTGAVAITSTARDGSGAQTVTIKDGSEVIIVNMSDDLRGSGKADSESDHFRIYRLLDKKRRLLGLAKSPKKDEIDKLGVGHLVSPHPFIAHLRKPPERGQTLKGVPEGQCSVTGCCAAWACSRG
jgi:hypothetical protein